ncbi:sulfite exporter TauE/SafE family protein [Granulosicoccus sp. 3-233]|uniref:sulfite exporter TauE/SafE family protein n=1 Tax=Granulosicoccus sp. 3-233 TaxID=3417969 RepID=UPI003D34408D
MVFSDLSLLAVFLTGLLGGVHCAGMCGGIVGALGMMQQKPLGRSPGIPVKVVSVGAGSGVPTEGLASASLAASHGGSAIQAVAAYNLGRIMTYTTLGALAGGIGSVAWLMQSMLPIQQTAYLFSSVLVILMGLYVSGVKRIGMAVESLGSHVWQHIRPAATSRLRGAGFLNSVMAGSLWGMVPCGMVYAVLSAALVAGSWQRGALLMLVFGLGTLPNLMLLGLSGQWLARASRRRWVRVLAGSLIIVLGVMGLLHLSMMHGAGHGA